LAHQLATFVRLRTLEAQVLATASTIPEKKSFRLDAAPESATLPVNAVKDSMLELLDRISKKISLLLTQMKCERDVYEEGTTSLEFTMTSRTVESS
jgi:hypothetical protein